LLELGTRWFVEGGIGWVFEVIRGPF